MTRYELTHLTKHERDILKTAKMAQAKKFNEAFNYGYDHGVFVSEDWITEAGVEYYCITVEDETFTFRTDEID